MCWEIVRASSEASSSCTSPEETPLTGAGAPRLNLEATCCAAASTGGVSPVMGSSTPAEPSRRPNHSLPPQAEAPRPRNELRET
eukprot:CAMPEP_0170635216 /NCGR_PEP_ID=MMETSP0224-20130122/37086_1 /TAXON_ID=285029 /ORGANISM="Togula jolla, Strain CCCM 725" /LENGTH=83 /DNA_ID=CAMNT_0010964667 /DNA_START=214 /DNA_END=462 /DNA_ORIENTATION=-